MEVIDTIYSDKVLTHEFGYLKDKNRDEIVSWAKKHGFRHTIILRLVAELKTMLHYRYLEICYQMQALEVGQTSGKALGTVAKTSRNRQGTVAKTNGKAQGTVATVANTERLYFAAYVLKHEVRNMFFQKQEKVIIDEEIAI